MIWLEKLYREVKGLLKVSHSFIVKLKKQALFHEVEILRLQYQGRIGCLKPEEKDQTIECFRIQDYQTCKTI